MSCCAADAEDVQYALNCNIESLLVLMSLNMLSSLLVNCACTENTVSDADSLLTHLQTQGQKSMPRADHAHCCYSECNTDLVAALSLELDQQ